MCIAEFLEALYRLGNRWKWDVKNVIGGAEEWDAIQAVADTWLRKRGDDKSFQGPCGKEKR
jgi:hypothetical protein